MEHQFFFTQRDHRLLSGLLRSDTSLSSTQRGLLGWKLDHCVVVDPADLPPWIATIGSRVRYRIGDGAPQTDRLTASNQWNGAGATLPLTTGRGLALVGLGEGHVLPFVDRCGQQQVVALDTVCFQPEAARAEWLAAAATGGRRIQAAR
ncbi:MAG: hypothetical protein ACO1OD_09615 [Croceibacterium sp.]